MSIQDWLNLLAGLKNTLIISVSSWVLGFTASFLAGYLAFLSGGMRTLVRWGSQLIVVIPFLVFLFWFHYPLQSMLEIVLDPFWTTVTLLTVFVALSGAEIVATALSDTMKRYSELARSLSMSPREFTIRVAIPLSAVRSAPPIVMLMIMTIHMTMFSSLIGVEELFRSALRLNAEILRPIEVFSAMGLLYLLVCLPLFIASLLLQRYYDSRRG